MLRDATLFTDEHVPRVLHHRESEVRTLTGAFQPALSGERADDILIAGPSGVGKTALARHTLQHVDQHANIASTHIDTLGESPAQILRAALRDYPTQIPVSHSTSQDDLEALARDHITQPYVLVLDEADDLPDIDTLAVLHDLPLVSVVIIAHEHHEWLARATDDTRSRLRVHLTPDRYTVSELTDILHPRARQGLRDDAITTAQLERIADDVAGVARRGIQALRAAAELAEERGHTTIQSGDIDDAYARARSRIRASNLQSLATHHHVLYELVRHHDDGVTTSDLNTVYDEHADRIYRDQPLAPIVPRTRRNKLAKLHAYDLLEKTGPDHDPVWHAVDGDLESPLALDFALA